MQLTRARGCFFFSFFRKDLEFLKEILKQKAPSLSLWFSEKLSSGSGWSSPTIGLGRLVINECRSSWLRSCLTPGFHMCIGVWGPSPERTVRVENHLRQSGPDHSECRCPCPSIDFLERSFMCWDVNMKSNADKRHTYDTNYVHSISMLI